MYKKGGEGGSVRDLFLHGSTSHWVSQMTPKLEAGSEVGLQPCSNGRSGEGKAGDLILKHCVCM